LRVTVKSFFVVCILAAVAVFAGAVRAQDEAAQDAAAVENQPLDEGHPQHQRALKKIRTGSMLRANEPFEEAPDLRGDFEKRRDQQVNLHYTRIAQLDVIAELAIASNNTTLLARVDEVRRRERERFRLAMEKLRIILRATGLKGLEQ